MEACHLPRGRNVHLTACQHTVSLPLCLNLRITTCLDIGSYAIWILTVSGASATICRLCGRTPTRLIIVLLADEQDDGALSDGGGGDDLTPEQSGQLCRVYRRWLNVLKLSQRETRSRVGAYSSYHRPRRTIRLHRFFHRGHIMGYLFRCGEQCEVHLR